MELFKSATKTPQSTSIEGAVTYEQALSTVKDLIAPSGLKVGTDYIELGERFVKTIFITVYPRFLDSGWLAPFINLDKEIDISIFIHPADTTTVLKNLKKKVAQVESQINVNAEKGLPRDPTLETAISDIENLRDALRQGVEKFYRFGLYLTVYAESKEKLNEATSHIQTMLESALIYSKPAMYQMENAFSSTLPLANDELFVHTNVNTSPLSTTFPFVSSDMTDNSGILYGINRHNNSLVLFDRFKMPNANSVVFAASGGGKSYFVKLEILRSLMYDIDIIVIDPEMEYREICDTVDGSFFNISLTSQHHLNPFDLLDPEGDETEADIIRGNIVNLIGLTRLMLGNLTPEEDSIVDEALRQTYALKDITLESGFKDKEMPTMSDFESVLAGMTGAESLSIRIKRYTTGAFSGFLNNPTNVDINNRLVVFNIRDMEEELRPIAMYIILNYIWGVVRSRLKKRLLIVDEAWVMMKYEDAGRFMHDIAKRARKYYLGVTTITQDVADFLSSPYGQPIVTNSSMQMLMKQSTATIDMVSQVFHLTDQEKFLLLESNVGEGIFFAGRKHVAIRVLASYSEDQIVTTNPAQLLEIEQAKQELAAAKGRGF